MIVKCVSCHKKLIINQYSEYRCSECEFNLSFHNIIKHVNKNNLIVFYNSLNFDIGNISYYFYNLFNGFFIRKWIFHIYDGNRIYREDDAYDLIKTDIISIPIIDGLIDTDYMVKAADRLYKLQLFI